MSFTNRWFLRCRLCLSIAAVDAQSLPKGTMTCGACDGPVEIMGRVDGCTSHLETGCKCDARCTNAKGPNCDCSCGGANHGKGMMTTITPVFDPSLPHVVNITATDKALAIVKEFREALIPVNRVIRLLTVKKGKDGYLQPADFSQLCFLERVRNAARKAKTHKSRMAILAQVTK